MENTSIPASSTCTSGTTDAGLVTLSDIDVHTLASGRGVHQGFITGLAVDQAQRLYSADETGAHMVGHPYGLISALQKLGAYNNRIPTTTISPSTSALCIVKPLFGGGTFSSLFSTHPPLEDRIATLREMVVTPRR